MTDSFGDGTPDFLRLDDEADRQAFRRWFTFLADVQYFNPADQRPSEINDCAALVRYAYREALRLHDSRWTADVHLPLVPAFDSVHKYNYPHTPLGAALFRVCSGPFQVSDLKSHVFAQFADADTLQRFNSFFVTREVSRSRPGDLLFFRRPTEHMPFHTMIFTGKSLVSGGEVNYVVYDTGSGEIRRLSLDELLHYPNPQWQPRSANPYFLGVFRWNILRAAA